MRPLFARSLLRLLDLSSAELDYLLKLSAFLKKQKKQGNEKPRLNGKNIVLIFEKDSTRTRCSFEVAAYDQGANITYIGATGSQFNHKESVKDSARVFGRLYDGIQYRGYGQAIVEQLAQYSAVPVWNGLTNEFHPTQLLADLLTMQEQLPHRPLNTLRIAYIGDARNNMGNSMLEAAALTGLDLRLVAPTECWPNADLFNHCQSLARSHGGNITLTTDIAAGVKAVDFIYTDVWVSMGEPKAVWAARIALLRDYQVNLSTLALTGNPKVKFFHCLPAFHDNETVIGSEIAKEFQLQEGLEVTHEVFESCHSVVFEQAENRMHTIKAMLVASLSESDPFSDD